VGNLDEYQPPAGKTQVLARTLQRYDIKVHQVGRFSISASSTTRQFERLFSTEVGHYEPPPMAGEESGTVYFAPIEGTPWELPTRGGLDELIDRAYVQRDPILFSGERAAKSERRNAKISRRILGALSSCDTFQE